METRHDDRHHVPSVFHHLFERQSQQRFVGFLQRDPYEYVDDPLTDESFASLAADSLMVNTRRSTSLSYSDSKNVGGMLQWNRRLGNRGRNVTLRADASYTDGTSQSLSLTNVHLYQVQNALGLDSTYQTNRYNVTPTEKLELQSAGHVQ